MNNKSCFILAHFGRRLPFSLPIGPAKCSKSEIVSLFEPELHLSDFSVDKNGELYYYCFLMIVTGKAKSGDRTILYYLAHSNY